MHFTSARARILENHSERRASTIRERIHQLMSKRGILSHEPADRPERRNQQPQKEDEQRDHRGRRYVIPSSDQTHEVFGTHRMSVAENSL
jgi:hypothetical protein